MAKTIFNFNTHKRMDTKVKKHKLMNNPIYHIEKKQKDSLETRVVLLIFLLELEMSGVVVQQMHQNTKKWLFSCGITY